MRFYKHPPCHWGAHTEGAASSQGWCPTGGLLSGAGSPAGLEGVPGCSRHRALTRTPSASLTDGQCTESQHLQAEILGEGPLVCCPLQVSAKLRSAPERPWVRGWGRRGGRGSRSTARGPSPTGTRSTSPAWADEEGLLFILMRRVFPWTSAATREPRGVRSLWGPETGSATLGTPEALLAGRWALSQLPVALGIPW